MATVTAPRRPAKTSKPAPVVSLCLAIDHQCYSVTPVTGIQTPDVLRAFRLEKKSDPDAVYDVAQHADGLIVCDCPHYEARIKGLSSAPCKHGKALVTLGLLTHGAAAPAPVVVVEPAPAVGLAAPAVVAGDPATRDQRHAAFMATVHAEDAARDAKWAAEVEASHQQPFAPAWTPAPVVTTPGDACEDEAESDPADWPAWTDGVSYTTAAPARPYEPSPADREWWAALLDGVSPADRRPVRYTRSRVVSDWSDSDQVRAHGYC